MLALYVYSSPYRFWFTHRVVRMKYVRRRRVVNDDYLVNFPSESAEVLYVVAAVEDAGLAKQARVENVPLIQ